VAGYGIIARSRALTVHPRTPGRESRTEDHLPVRTLSTKRHLLTNLSIRMDSQVANLRLDGRRSVSNRGRGTRRFRTGASYVPSFLSFFPSFLCPLSLRPFVPSSLPSFVPSFLLPFRLYSERALDTNLVESRIAGSNHPAKNCRIEDWCYRCWTCSKSSFICF